MKLVRSVSNKIAIVISIALLVVLSVITVSVSIVFSQTIRDNALELSQASLDRTSNAISAWVNEKTASLNVVGISCENELSEKLTIQKLCEKLINYDKDFYDVYFASANSPNDGGFFIDGSGWVPPSDYNWLEREWYTGALAKSSFYYTDPYIDADTKKMVITFSKAVKKDDEIIGVIAGDIFVTRVGEIVAESKITKNSEVNLINSEGIFISNVDSKKVLEGSIFKEDPYLEAEKAALIEGKFLFVEIEKNQSYFTAKKLANLPWTIAARGPLTDIFSSMRNSINIIILISVIGLIIIVVFVGIFTTIQLKSIHTVSKTMAAMAKGDADLSGRISVRKNKHDEIALLSRDFNTFLDFMASMISSLKNQSDILERTQLSVTSSVEETSASVHEISATLNSIDENAKRERELVTQTVSGVKKLVDKLHDLKHSSDKQIQNLKQTELNLSSVSKSIENSLVISTRGEEISKSVVISANENEKDIKEQVGIIKAVAEQSRRVTEIVTVIGDIAEKTNLLAMNAAIEAAHAGERGAGFTVVSGEIRKLAEDTSSQAEEIKRTINKVNDLVNSAVEKSTHSTESLKILLLEIQKSLTIVHEMRDGIENQVEMNTCIIDSMKLIELNSNELGNAMNDGAEVSEHVMQLHKELTNFNSEVTSSISEQAIGLRQINDAMNDVAREVAVVRDISLELATSISKFKL